MGSNTLLVLGSREVQDCLRGREADVLLAVKSAYIAHRSKDTVLPESTFLRIPTVPSARIIALPAFLGNEISIAGVKWISSFPANTDAGLDRASAVVAINSITTGRVEALLEGSLVSAHRTAASAALAAQVLHRAYTPASIGLIGCGFINRYVLHYCWQVFGQFSRVVFFDINPAKAVETEQRTRVLRHGVKTRVAESIKELLVASDIVSFATTSSTPYVADLSSCASGATILHISLRDLSPEVILNVDNVVDDAKHVCREGTSLHLANQMKGNSGFIRCTLADVLVEKEFRERRSDRIVVFSPFGLGILDLAVARLVLQTARERKLGTSIPDFHPVRDL